MRAPTTLPAVLLVLLAACAEQRVPTELIDVWRTQASGYEDRFLEVRADAVLFGTGKGTSTGYRLDRVLVEPDGKGRVHCTLRYRLDEGGVAQLRLVLEPGPPSTLRIENREETWHREAEAAWLAKGSTG
jgi:hypothetical protein